MKLKRKDRLDYENKHGTIKIKFDDASSARVRFFPSDEDIEKALQNLSKSPVSKETEEGI